MQKHAMNSKSNTSYLLVQSRMWLTRKGTNFSCFSTFRPAFQDVVVKTYYPPPKDLYTAHPPH